MTANKKTTEFQNKMSIKLAHPFIRLINVLIDTIVWLTLYILVAYVLDEYVLRFSSYMVNYIYSISLALILYLGYYVGMEYYFQKTIGKFVTGTKVVNHNGKALTLSTIFKRTVSRLIPIDVFFYLFSKQGLHDKLSNTLVIKNML